MLRSDIKNMNQDPQELQAFFASEFGKQLIESYGYKSFDHNSKVGELIREIWAKWGLQKGTAMFGIYLAVISSISLTKTPTAANFAQAAIDNFGLIEPMIRDRIKRSQILQWTPLPSAMTTIGKGPALRIPGLPNFLSHPQGASLIPDELKAFFMPRFLLFSIYFTRLVNYESPESSKKKGSKKVEVTQSDKIAEIMERPLVTNEVDNALTYTTLSSGETILDNYSKKSLFCYLCSLEYKTKDAFELAMHQSLSAEMPGLKKSDENWECPAMEIDPNQISFDAELILEPWAINERTIDLLRTMMPMHNIHSKLLISESKDKTGTVRAARLAAILPKYFPMSKDKTSWLSILQPSKTIAKIEEENDNKNVVIEEYDLMYGDIAHLVRNGDGIYPSFSITLSASQLIPVRAKERHGRVLSFDTIRSEALSKRESRIAERIEEAVFEIDVEIRLHKKKSELESLKAGNAYLDEFNQIVMKNDY